MAEDNSLEQLYLTFEGAATRAEIKAAWDKTFGTNDIRFSVAIDILTGATMGSDDADSDFDPRHSPPAPAAPKAGPSSSKRAEVAAVANNSPPRAGPSNLNKRVFEHRKQEIISISSDSDDEDEPVFVAVKGKGKAKAPPPPKVVARKPVVVAPPPPRQLSSSPPPQLRSPLIAAVARPPFPPFRPAQHPNGAAAAGPSVNGNANAGGSNLASSIALPASPPPEPKDDPHSTALAQILSLLGDIDPTHASEVVTKLITVKGFHQPDQIVDQAMDEFFSNPKGYPKLTKRKRDGEDEGGSGESGSPSKKRKGGGGKEVNYLSEDRNGSGEDYMRLSFESLYEEFAYVPLDFIKKTFFKTALYVPAYYAIQAATQMDPRPYKTKQAPYKSKGKSKAKYNAEWDAERSWLVERSQKVQQEKDDKIAEELHQKEVEESGEGIECGCCFGIAPFEKCVQCDEGHLFCTDCIEAHANNELGAQKTDILCMDGDGCKAPFPESELARTLPPKTMSLLQRLIQQKHIKDAGLEGLESCPFCDFSICIDNPDEKLFNCQACEKISCRSCKKEEHLPKSCEEMAKDNKLDHRHHIEEEMTKALIRVCPNTTCKAPTLKEMGCNKMLCSVCRTLFCYVCSMIIKDYSHFDQSPADYSKPKDKAKCPLWEDMNARHAKEVADARDRAQAELKARGGDINDEDIDVALPDPVAPQPAGYIPVGLPHGGQPPRPVPAAGPVPAAYRAALNLGGDPRDANLFAQAAGLLGPRAMAHLPAYIPPPPPPRAAPAPRAKAQVKRPVGRPKKQ